MNYQLFYTKRLQENKGGGVNYHAVKNGKEKIHVVDYRFIIIGEIFFDQIYIEVKEGMSKLGEKLEEDTLLRS